MADGGVARGRVFRGAVEPLASYRQVILLYGPIKYMHPFAGLAHPASDFEASNRKHGMPVGSGRLALRSRRRSAWCRLDGDTYLKVASSSS